MKLYKSDLLHSNLIAPVLAVFVCIFALGIVAGLRAQETITLTAPEVRTTSTYGGDTLIVTFDDPATVGVDESNLTIYVKGANGETRVCNYNATTTPTAATLVNGLNKANLSSAYAGNASTGSLKQRVHHRLVVMGEAAQVCNGPLVGTLTGSVP